MWTFRMFARGSNDVNTNLASKKCAQIAGSRPEYGGTPDIFSVEPATGTLERMLPRYMAVSIQASYAYVTLCHNVVRYMHQYTQSVFMHSTRVSRHSQKPRCIASQILSICIYILYTYLPTYLPTYIHNHINTYIHSTYMCIYDKNVYIYNYIYIYIHIIHTYPRLYIYNRRMHFHFHAHALMHVST